MTDNGYKNLEYGSAQSVINTHHYHKVPPSVKLVMA